MGLRASFFFLPSSNFHTNKGQWGHGRFCMHIKKLWPYRSFWLHGPARTRFCLSCTQKYCKHGIFKSHADFFVWKNSRNASFFFLSSSNFPMQQSVMVQTKTFGPICFKFFPLKENRTYPMGLHLLIS